MASHGHNTVTIENISNQYREYQAIEDINVTLKNMELYFVVDFDNLIPYATIFELLAEAISVELLWSLKKTLEWNCARFCQGLLLREVLGPSISIESSDSICILLQLDNLQ